MPEDVLTKEDKEQLEKDIAEAKKALTDKTVETAVQKAKTEAKAEAEKEFKLQKELEDQRKKAEELQKQLEDQKKALQGQIDELRTTKAVIEPPKNPFTTNRPVDVGFMSDDQMKAIEAASMEAFLSERSRPADR